MSNINNFGEQHWYVVTLVDITETGVFREKGKRRNQQRNLDTLLQTISMFSQPTCMPVRHVTTSYNIQSLLLGMDPQKQMFGSRFMFTQKMFNQDYKVWILPFYPDHVDVFGLDGESLIQALHNVPVNVGLDETQEFKYNIFDTLDSEHKNTIIFYSEHP